MNLVKQIGKHTFDILAVVLVTALDDGNFEFILPHDVRVTLTADEKAEYDEAVNRHKQVLYVYGAARSAGLRG